MKSKRFFVTYVLVLGMLVGFALNAVRPSLADETTRLAIEANTKISEMKNMDLNLSERIEWNLNLHSLQERRQLKQDLAHYLSTMNRVFEIGSMRHLFLEDRELLLDRRTRAEVAQKAIEQFEDKFGETFEPKRMVMNARPKKIL